jgi:hypothetical protein
MFTRQWIDIFQRHNNLKPAYKQYRASVDPDLKFKILTRNILLFTILQSDDRCGSMTKPILATP